MIRCCDVVSGVSLQRKCRNVNNFSGHMTYFGLSQLKLKQVQAVAYRHRLKGIITTILENSLYNHHSKIKDRLLKIQSLAFCDIIFYKILMINNNTYLKSIADLQSNIEEFNSSQKEPSHKVYNLNFLSIRTKKSRKRIQGQ